MKKLALLFWTCVILSGCTTAPKVDIQAEKDAIQNIEDQWTIALQTKDIEKILSLYANEAINMRPNQPIIIGNDAIRKRVESMFADTTLLFNTYTGKVDMIELSVAGDMAYSYGHDEIMVKTKNRII